MFGMKSAADWSESFPDSFAARKGTIGESLNPSTEAIKLILALNQDPDIFWLFTTSDKILLLPFLFGSESNPSLVDSSGILSDYRLMLMTPPDIDGQESGAWPLAELMSNDQKTIVARVLESIEEWDAHDMNYPNWVARQEYWSQFL